MEKKFAEFAKEFDDHRAAIEAALAGGYTINKYADPLEGERMRLSVEEALEVAREDAGLLWLYRRR